MPHPAFDTLKFVETLKDSGISDKQARGALKAIDEVLDETHHQLATKADLLITQTTLKLELIETENRLTQKIQDIETRLTEKIQNIETHSTQKIQDLDSKVNKTEQNIILLKWMTGALMPGVLALVCKAFF